MTEPLAIAFLRLSHGEGLALPARQSALAAGADLSAAIGEDAELEIGPGGRALVPCGFSMALPEGFEAQVRPRSGLALKHGITLLNSPGTIDADYRGEVGVILINLGQESFTIRRGERIAQLVLAPVSRLAWSEQHADLAGTQRGAGGFGSTGRKTGGSATSA